MTITRISEKEAPSAVGCWVDGHWGQYSMARLVQIAEAHGYDDQVVIGIADRHLGECSYPGTDNHITDDEHEILSDAEVEMWLNDNVAPKGYGFTWHDGEFFFQTNEWIEED